MSDTEGFTLWGIVTVICITIIALAGCQMCETTARDKAAVQAGLVQKRTVTGVIIWTKPCEVADE